MALQKMGADVSLAGPRTMVYPEFEKLGVTVHHDIFVKQWLMQM